MTLRDLDWHLNRSEALLAIVATSLMMTGCVQSERDAGEHPQRWQPCDVTVLHASEVEWQALNPARGDQSPRAATLWGDRNGDEQTGFLVQFVDGFSSPPHIHNVTYRGVVISGLVHNDDPAAAKMWMPTGSFWTQPKGEAHITAAKGDKNIAYIEIDAGPYLVWPSTDAFDNGERPVNIDASNIVWQRFDHTGYAQPQIDERVRTAILWKNTSGTEVHGRFIKISGQLDGQLGFDEGQARGVVIKGALQVGSDSGDLLSPGSSFMIQGPGAVTVRTHSETESIVYLRMSGDISVRADRNASFD